MKYSLIILSIIIVMLSSCDADSSGGSEPIPDPMPIPDPPLNLFEVNHYTELGFDKSDNITGDNIVDKLRERSLNWEETSVTSFSMNSDSNQNVKTKAMSLRNIPEQLLYMYRNADGIVNISSNNTGSYKFEDDFILNLIVVNDRGEGFYTEVAIEYHGAAYVMINLQEAFPNIDSLGEYNVFAQCVSKNEFSLNRPELKPYTIYEIKIENHIEPISLQRLDNIFYLFGWDWRDDAGTITPQNMVSELEKRSLNWVDGVLTAPSMSIGTVTTKHIKEAFYDEEHKLIQDSYGLYFYRDANDVVNISYTIKPGQEPGSIYGHYYQIKIIVINDEGKGFHLEKYKTYADEEGGYDVIDLRAEFSSKMYWDMLGSRYKVFAFVRVFNAENYERAEFYNNIYKIEVE